MNEYSESIRYCFSSQKDCDRGCVGLCKIGANTTSTSILPTKPAKDWTDDVKDILILAAVITAIQLVFIGIPVFTYCLYRG